MGGSIHFDSTDKEVQRRLRKFEKQCKMLHLLLAVFVVMVGEVVGLEPCPGDTRGDKRCNFDSTHRVCAKIGVLGTSFWRFTGQQSWCETRGSYYGEHGNDLRCPRNEPTWCICKWATAKWIAGEGCNDSIQFNCAATDVCNLRRSFYDFDTDLKPAHDCVKQKCKEQWDACSEEELGCQDDNEYCGGWKIYCEDTRYRNWMSRNCMKTCGKCPGS